MVAKDYLGRSRLFQRLKNGAHGELVERYAIRCRATIKVRQRMPKPTTFWP